MHEAKGVLPIERLPPIFLGEALCDRVLLKLRKPRLLVRVLPLQPVFARPRIVLPADVPALYVR